MKVALVYTGTTPELIDKVEGEVKKNLGSDVELLSLADPTIISGATEAGYVTAPLAARLMSMFADAVSSGVDAILNVCSSVGEVADAAQDFARYVGVPIVRIDEEMCREAVRAGKRIGVMATLPTTMLPTVNTILRVAREMGKRVEPVEALLEGAYGLSPDEFRARMLAKAQEIAAQVDVILFAQGSMAYCEEYIAQNTGKITLSSPRFGAIALKQTLVSKGLLQAD